MEYKIPAVLKNIKIPKELELIKEADCQKGDVVLVKALDSTSQTTISYLRKPNGDKFKINKGDLFLSAVTNRYAPTIVEGVVPKHLRVGDRIDLLHQGGTCGKITNARGDFKTLKLEFQGFLSKSGNKVSMKDYALPLRNLDKVSIPKSIIIVGTCEETGKTTATSCLCQGLTKKGYKIGGGKLTGIGSVYDSGSYLKSGAIESYGVIDAGYPSSVGLSQNELENVFLRIFTNLVHAKPDFILLEIADGILQRETAMLIKSKELLKLNPIFIFACNDACGAYGGKVILERKYSIKPIIITGKGAMTKLGREEIKEITGIKSFDPITQQKEMTDYLLKSCR